MWKKVGIDQHHGVHFKTGRGEETTEANGIKRGKKNVYKDTCYSGDSVESYDDVWLCCFHFVYLSPRLVKHKMKDHENSAEVKQK